MVVTLLELVLLRLTECNDESIRLWGTALATNRNIYTQTRAPFFKKKLLKLDEEMKDENDENILSYLDTRYISTDFHFQNENENATQALYTRLTLRLLVEQTLTSEHTEH